MYISGIWGGARTSGRIEPKFFLEEGIRDIITCFKFGDDRFRCLASAEGQILPFPIDFDGRPYNTLTLPCERVMRHNSTIFSLQHCEHIVKVRLRLNWLHGYTGLHGITDKQGAENHHTQLKKLNRVG